MTVRFVLALVTLVIAVVLVGLGIAQRTVFAGADNVTAVSEVESDVAVTVLEGETLNALPGLQDIRIGGSERIFAAYAPTTDVLAWVGDATYNRLGFDPETNELTNSVVAGDEAAVPSPVDSDLWLKQYSGEDDLRMPVKLAPDLSVLIVSDGTAPAPAEVSITWPLDNRTPWAGPLLAGGAIALLLAFVFFVWALLHQRRVRGPRRKSIKPSRSPRMPKLPRQRSYRVRKPKAIAQSRGRRSIRRMTAVLPITLTGVLLLGGCSADIWPGVDDLPTPSSSPSVSAAPEVAEPPAAAATVGQVKAIIDDIAEVAAAADASLDAEALKPRFAGPALDLRAGNYAIRKADSAYVAPGAIPTDTVAVSLPQITGDTWPRTMMVVVQGGGDTPTAPVALTLEQETARDKYKVLYLVTLEPGVEFPQLAPEGVGALPLGPESPVLSTQPGALMPAYTDVVNVGDQSASYGLFDIETDTFLPQIGAASRDARKAAVGAAAALEFANVPGTSEIIALSSNEAGALVSASLKETVTAKPIEAGASVTSEGAIKSLSGVATSTKGFVADYSDQLLFYIPPVGSTDKIVLLGFAQGLVSAKELP